MKLFATYCSTPDGFGKDFTDELPVDGNIILFSNHKQDETLELYVLAYLGIQSQQLISVRLSE